MDFGDDPPSGVHRRNNTGIGQTPAPVMMSPGSPEFHPAIHPGKTQFSVEIKVLIGIIAVVFAGGVTAGVQLNQMTMRIGALEERLAQTPTKKDFEALKAEIRTLRSRMKRMIVVCPTNVPRGQANVQCEAVITLGDDE